MAALQDCSVQCGVHQPMDVPKTLSGLSKYYFMIALRHICFSSVDIYTDVTIAMAGKLLGNLAQIKTEAANSANSHGIFHLQASIIGKHVQ